MTRKPKFLMTEKELRMTLRLLTKDITAKNFRSWYIPDTERYGVWMSNELIEKLAIKAIRRLVRSK